MIVCRLLPVTCYSRKAGVAGESAGPMTLVPLASWDDQLEPGDLMLTYLGSPVLPQVTALRVQVGTGNLGGLC